MRRWTSRGQHDRVARNAGYVVTPLSWIIFWLGIVLLWCTLAILRFDVISSAPAEEPITGLLHRYPAAERPFSPSCCTGRQPSAA